MFVSCAVFWTVPEQPPCTKRWRLAELATVSNSECQKALCVGVVVVLVLRLFLPFLKFHIDVQLAYF